MQLTKGIGTKNKLLGEDKEQAMGLEHKEEAEAEILTKESSAPTATK